MKNCVSFSGAIRALSLFLILCWPAAAQNLLQNGTFDTNVSGWRNFDSNIVPSWSPLDADGSPSSGSMLVANQAPQGLNAGMSQCVASVTPGTRLDAGGKFFIPSGHAQGQSFLIVFFASGANCTGSIVGNTAIVGVTTFDKWTGVALTDLVVPEGARSATMQLSVIKNFPNTLTYDTHFDDLYLVTASPATLTVPASASIHGLNDTYFQTDLWATNLSRTAALTVSARHRCFSSQSCGTAAKTIQLAPRETKLYSDVLVSLFGDKETSGAIELTYDAAVGTLAATSRTYTPPLPAATAGSVIPALPASEARTSAVFLGLGHNGGDRSAGFRSNAGAYNPGSSSVPVLFKLQGPDGALLGTVSATLAANEVVQVNDVFAAAGAGSLVTTNAVLTVTATSPVFAYVTVVDNRSGDTSYALPFTDPAP